MLLTADGTTENHTAAPTVKQVASKTATCAVR